MADLGVFTKRARPRGQQEYSGYLQQYPDVQQHWDQNVNNVQNEYANAEEWARAHYAQMGQAEGRTMGGFPAPNDPVTMRTAGGEPAPVSVPDQWNQIGQQLQTQTPQTAPNPLMDALAGRVLNPDGTLAQASVNANDPLIRNQVEAFSAQQERARRQYLQELAESSGPYSNLRGEQRMSAESLGQNVGMFESELMGRELESQRAQLSQYLQAYGSLLTEQQRQQLQTQMALLEAQIRESEFSRRYELDVETQRAYFDAVRRGLFRE